MTTSRQFLNELDARHGKWWTDDDDFICEALDEFARRRISELTIKDDGKKEGKEQQESGRAESQDKDSLE